MKTLSLIQSTSSVFAGTAFLISRPSSMSVLWACLITFLLGAVGAAHLIIWWLRRSFRDSAPVFVIARRPLEEETELLQ